MGWLSFIILCPLATALLIAAIPRSYRVLFRLLAVTASALSLFGAARVFLGFRTGMAGLQFEEYAPWIEAIGAGWHLGVDGLSVGLLLMAALVGFAAVCVAREINRREKEFYLLLLLLIAGVLGAFATLDLLLFYVFHELALVPTFLMIGIWGRGPDRSYAAFNLTLYLSLGALISLLGLIGLYAGAGFRTLDMIELQRQLTLHPIAGGWQGTLFGLLLFGFGILVSLWPFHTWAPLGYSAAPTSAAMLHAGVLKKFGLYGLIRVALPMLPEGARDWLPVLAVLCLGNILYISLVTLRQRDLNRLAAYASVAHVGFALLGIASLTVLGITGAVVVMVAHGLVAALLFGMNGWLLERTGTVQMERLGGLLQRMPFAGTVLVMAMLAGCGLPGFAAFAGEVTVLFGAWQYAGWLAVLATWGALVLASVYMLRAIRAVFHGPLPESLHDATDMTHPWHKVPFVLLLAALIGFGVWPRALTDKVQPVAANIVAQAQSWALQRDLPSADPGALLAGAEAAGDAPGAGEVTR